MSRIIVENRTNIHDGQALYYAACVVEKGRISGEGDKAQYCYLTAFKDGTKVSAFKNKSSDRLVVHD